MLNDSSSDNIDKIKKAYERVRFYQDVLTHDMNNMINNINLSLILLSPKYRNKNKISNIDETLDIINNQIKKAAYLVSKVQKLSLTEDIMIPLETIDVCQILNDTIDLIYKRFQDKSIKIDFKDLELKIINSLNTIEEKKQDIIKSKNEIEERKTEIKILSSKKEELNREIQEIIFKNTSLTEKIANIRNIKDDNQNKLERLTESILPMQEILSGIEIEINKHSNSSESHKNKIEDLMKLFYR